MRVPLVPIEPTFEHFEQYSGLVLAIPECASMPQAAKSALTASTIQGQEPPLRRTDESPQPASTPAGTQAPTGQGPLGDPMMCLQSAWPLLLVFVVFYFLILRPQQKQEKARRSMLSALKAGDEVVTSGGIWGKVASLTDDVVTLRIDDKVKITVDRAHIGRVVRVEPVAKEP